MKQIQDLAYLNRVKLLFALCSAIVGRWEVSLSVGRKTRIVREDSFHTKRWRYGILCWPL